MAEHLSSEQKVVGSSPIWSSSYHEIPGSNPGQGLTPCWPNGKARDYGQ